VAARDETTIQELQELLQEQQRQEEHARLTMAAAELQLQQISQRSIELGQELTQREEQVADLQVTACARQLYEKLIPSAASCSCSCMRLARRWPRPGKIGPLRLRHSRQRLQQRSRAKLIRTL
jgi:hypothetical protein